VKGIFHEVTLRQAIQDAIEQGRGFYDLRVFPHVAGRADSGAALGQMAASQSDQPLLVTEQTYGAPSALKVRIVEKQP
jgi:hypothetical protein